MLAVVGVFLILVFYKCQFWVKKNKYNESYLSKEQTNILKGISAILILFVHLYPNTGNNRILWPFHSIGYIVVGIFFFFSGFGVALGCKKKDNYIKGFLKKRFISLFIPLLFTNTIYLAVHIGAFSERFTILEILEYLCGIKLLNSAAWFIRVLMILFIFFWFCIKIGKGNQKYSIIVLTVLISVFTIIAFATGNKAESGSCYGFLLGSMVGFYKDELETWMSSHYKPAFLFTSVLTVCFCGLYMVFYDYPWLGTLLFRNISAICAMGLFYTLIFCVHFGNAALRGLGSISREIYLLHMLWIQIFNYYSIFNNNTVCYVLGVLVLTVLSSVCLKQVLKIIKV